MIVSLAQRKSESIQKWRRQIGCRMQLRGRQGPRPHALLTYQIDVEPENGLVPLNQILFLVLYDEELRNDRCELELRTRFSGYRAAMDNGRVQIGGTARCRFSKDLRRSPAVGGRGSRLDALDRELVDQALAAERHLERHSRHPHYPRRNSPKVPSLWAVSNQATADREDFKKLVVLEEMPVTGSFAEVFVDLRSLPKRQVLNVDQPQRDLCGRAGLVEFDFFHTPYHANI